MRNDLNLPVALLADLHRVAEISHSVVNFYLVVQEFLEGGDIEYFVRGGLRGVDDELLPGVLHQSRRFLKTPSRSLGCATDLPGDFRRLATFRGRHACSFLFEGGCLAYCPKRPGSGRRGNSKAVDGRAYCGMLGSHLD